jgi:hypothetical protein
MKKLTFIAVAGLAFTFASCKKDYTCECTWTDDNTSAGSYTAKLKKKDAETWCEGNSGSSYIDCKLK